MTTMYAKVETLADGGQKITVWQPTELRATWVDIALGVPDSVNLLDLEQVVNARDGVGTFASVPGGLAG
jgi:hypothetical protein